jgi:hypothetical protein
VCFKESKIRFLVIVKWCWSHTNSHGITEILLKVALNTINQQNTNMFIYSIYIYVIIFTCHHRYTDWFKQLRQSLWRLTNYDNWIAEHCGG